MNMYKYFPFMLFISFWLLVTPVSAQTIVYIPMDDRPVNLEYVVDTAQAAGVDIDNRDVPFCHLWKRGFDLSCSQGRK